MITTTIPFAKLRLSDANVRKNTANAETALTALAASIAEHGLLQPLIVAPAKGKKTLYDVHAGGRRLRAIAALVEAGTLPRDHQVEVRLCDDEDSAAREISLVENLMREAMTPADECTAFRDIIAEGSSVEDLARRFGVTVRHVHGRMRLADLAPPIFAALSAGEITLDVAMAYASTSDEAQQLAAWERCSRSWQSDNPQAIRRAIGEGSLSATDPIALLVGEADYVAAGGRVERDLFAAEGEGIWLDPAIARDLAAKKLTFEAEVAQLGARLAWVKPLVNTRVTYEDSKDLQCFFPERAPISAEAQARMDEIRQTISLLEEQIEDLEDEDAIDAIYTEQEKLSAEYDALAKTEVIIPDEDRTHVGTFLVIGADGVPELWPNYYTARAPQRRAASDNAADDANDGEGEDYGAVNQAPDTLPRSLEEQLARDRRDILALHVAHDPALALDLAIFSLARDHAGHFGYDDSGCAIRIGDRGDPAGLKDIPASEAVEQLEQLRTALPADWAREADSFASFLAFRALDEATRANWLAFAVSQSLKASLLSGQHRNAFQSQLGALIGIDPARFWRPGAERFFDRLTKSQILSVLGEIDPAMPARYLTAKKGELASAATKLCAGEAIVEPEVKNRALAWVPEQLLFTPGAAAEDTDDATDDLGADHEQSADGEDVEEDPVGEGSQYAAAA